MCHPRQKLMDVALFVDTDAVGRLAMIGEEREQLGTNSTRRSKVENGKTLNWSVQYSSCRSSSNVGIHSAKVGRFRV